MREPDGPGHRGRHPPPLSASLERGDPHPRPPLVCLQGQPSAAALTLLHRVPWHPWRYTAADYRTAAAATPLAPPLTGTPTAAAWDPDLNPALAELGVRIEEEAVLDTLLADLAP